MVDTYSLVLQSPSYNGTDGSGSQLPLPGIQWSNAGNAMSTILTLPDKNNVEFGFGMHQETISLQGVFTDTNIAGENWRYDTVNNVWETYKDALHARDVLLRARKIWETEAASGKWNDGTGLPSDEEDDEDRSRGKIRLILDKTYLTDHYEGTIPSRGQTLNLQFAFVYGGLQGYSEKHVGASHRYRIPFQIDFQPVKVKFSFGQIFS